MELSRGFRWRPQQSSPSAGPPGPTVRRGRAGHCRAASLQLLGSPRSHPPLPDAETAAGSYNSGEPQREGPRASVPGAGRGAAAAWARSLRREPEAARLSPRPPGILCTTRLRPGAPTPRRLPATCAWQLRGRRLPALCSRGGCAWICRSQPGTHVQPCVLRPAAAAQGLRLLRAQPTTWRGWRAASRLTPPPGHFYG